MAKRTEVMIMEDRARVCNLLMKGYRSKAEIASIINEGRDVRFHISPSQVGADIEYMRQQHLKRGLEDYNAFRNRLLDEYSMLKRTYWEGYELSRRNKVTIESEAVVDEEQYQVDRSEGLGLQADENVFLRNARTKEEQRLEGNPAFLQGVERVLEREAKIYGVDAPSKVALTDSQGKDVGSVYDVMKRKLEEAAQRVGIAEKLLEEKNQANVVDAEIIEEKSTEENDA